MGIILKTQSCEKNFQKELQDDLSKYCNKQASRSFGYLLYELASLPNLESMKARLDMIEKRRAAFIKLGMKPDSPPIKADEFRKKIEKLFNELKNCRENKEHKDGKKDKEDKTDNAKYIEQIQQQKNHFENCNWEPAENGDQKGAVIQYVRYLLRKSAVQLIADAGGA